MSERYCCANAGRRAAVAKPPATINGIDFLEVELGATVMSPVVLHVSFLHPLTGPDAVGSALTPAQVLVRGGARFKDPKVAGILAAGRALTVTMAPGQLYDYATYRLILARIPSDPDAGPPTGFDPELAAVDLSFKVTCPSDLDCTDETPCPPPAWPSPPIDYLAKDYGSFRRLMLDRLSVLQRGWTERNPADQQIMLVEMLAHAADQLSWYQDAVATEAYLGTARLRTSLRRHARLLDYPMHDGCNARAFVAITYEPPTPVQDGATLDAGSRILTRAGTSTPAIPTTGLERALDDGPLVFETMHETVLWAAHNRIALYGWSNRGCTLAAGATRATLADPGRRLRLVPGDFLLIEEIAGRDSGVRADADRRHRHVVRLTGADRIEDPLDGTKLLEVRWDPADALPVSIRLDADVGDPPVATVIAVARGNIVLADHGLTVTDTALDPPLPEDDRWRPRLSTPQIVFRGPYDPEAPATLAVRQDPRQAVAQVKLVEDTAPWAVERDLLASGRFETDFAVEAEADGSARLRFGDGAGGRRPALGAVFDIETRSGGGAAGNVGAETLTRLVTDLKGVTGVRNPLAAVGGTDPESAAQVRAFAPEAFRIQERAVTLEDYAMVAERHPEVGHARAVLAWTGGWDTVFLHVDRVGGGAVAGDPAFTGRMLAHLERYRLMGHDIELKGAVDLPLDIALFVCAEPRTLRGDLEGRLLAALGRFALPGGGLGFFHPDRWTFGQSLESSDLIAAVHAVPGVASVEIRKLERYGRVPAGERAAGRVAAQDLEIIRCDNDPSFRERGIIEIKVGGGA